MTKQSQETNVSVRYYRNNTQIGRPRLGFNWKWEDSFICPECKTYLFVLWEELSVNGDQLECPKCKQRFLVTCSLNEFPDRILVGAPYPGFNISNENVFRCPTCLTYLKDKEHNLPKERECSHCNTFWIFYPHEMREDIESGKIE